MKIALSSSVAASFVLIGTALAAGIVGTNRSETIRGTPGADKLYGLAGHDRLIGGAGRDVVYGGPGADRLLLRDGERDVAACGPGRDTVLADGADVVLADCETMIVVPPEPYAPPPRPVVAGCVRRPDDAGRARDVSGRLRRSAVQAGVSGDSGCRALPPAGLSVVWAQDFGAAVYLVGRDGTFTVERVGGTA